MDEKQKKILTELLNKNNYRVHVKNIENGLLAIFPERVEHPSTHQAFFYYSCNDNSINIIVKDIEENIKVNIDYECPKYAQVLLIIADILYRCINIGYSTSFINFVINDKEVDEDMFFTIIEEEENEQIEKLKPLVLAMIYEGNMSGEEVSKTLDVYEGYMAIKKFLSMSYGIKQ